MVGEYWTFKCQDYSDAPCGNHRVLSFVYNFNQNDILTLRMIPEVHQTRALSPSFTKTGEETRTHDLERVHKGKKSFLGPLGRFTLSFGFALSVPGLLLLIFFIKSSPVRIRLYKSSELIESFMKPTQFESLFTATLKLG